MRKKLVSICLNLTNWQISMRITQAEKSCLAKSIEESFGPKTKIWLFGSRTNNSKHGGDIDIYIEHEPQENIVKSKLKFRKLIWPVFGEQKIDLITHDVSLEPTAFHELAKKTGILLN